MNQFDIKTLSDFLELPITQTDLEFLEEKKKQKIEKKNNTIIIKCEKNLNKYFNKNKSKQQRSAAIISSYFQYFIIRDNY